MYDARAKARIEEEKEEEAWALKMNEWREE